ncbi:MAG TPA: hypothetical protein VNX88_00520 [Terriglobales bacterium]|nr:hypothetical protein [Terriglobales bacterium]
MRKNCAQSRWALARSLKSSSCLFFVVLSLVSASLAADSAPAVDLNGGFQQMYNLDFEGAHLTFARWEQAHPDDPMGPVSNAAAYLFAEFNRLKILEFDLFTQNDKFEKRPKLSPDESVKTSFENELQRGDRIAGRRLTTAPNDLHAMFSLVMINGLRSDYTAMIEKKNLLALSYTKSSRAMAERLLAADPSYYDAYLAIGVENYLLSLNPAPIRWILHLGGAQTDKAEGLDKLRLTAEKGHYFAPFARLLLAVAALRDKDRSTARDLLAGLSREFPGNDLYRKELARIQP